MIKKSIKQKVYNFTAIFELNEGGSYTITVPALPGLVTEGKNLEDAHLMVEDAIHCYVAGLIKAKERVPLEREIAQLRLAVKV
ncbi:type II toxin-antitoxin system HicB family antitoxin [Patescibacteria group bacterium]|nr:type II toxin-antitoxin system HicB family antitoxin [Patescibacteria group bacterium]